MVTEPKGWFAMRSTVRDLMTERVVAVRKDASFKEMIARMRESQISAFPVIDGAGKVIGVVSEADMLNKEAEQAGAGSIASILRFRGHEKAAGITAGELMTSPPVTIGPDALVVEAARLMRDRRVKRLPVTNATGRLIGIVTRADVLSVFTRPDEKIRHEVTEEISRGDLLVQPEGFNVTVRDGIVTLTGRPETDQAGHDLVEAVKHIEGVVTVRDQLRYAGKLH
jgi:CBS domain-containing protein